MCFEKTKRQRDLSAESSTLYLKMLKTQRPESNSEYKELTNTVNYSMITVPTLPMFTREPFNRSKDISASGIHPEGIYISASEEVNGSCQRKFKKKSGYRRSQSEKQEEKSQNEVLDNSSCNKHHHRHRRHRSQNRNRIRKEQSEELPPGNISAMSSGASSLTRDQTCEDSPRSILSPDKNSACSSEEEFPEDPKTLLTKIKHLEAVNQELNEKLQATSSADSGYQPSTEESIQQKDQEISNLQYNLFELYQLHQATLKERDTLRFRLQELMSKGEANTERRIQELQDEKKLLLEDVGMLKNLVYRLNVELDRYQQRFQKLSEDGYDPLADIKLVDTKYQDRDGALEWDKINRETLGPLLIAYSETIKEKEDLLHDLQENSKQSVTKCKVLAQENAKLYQELEDLKRKKEDLEKDWQELKQDIVFTQEQNDLLTNQVDLKKSQLLEVQVAYKQRVADITKNLEEMCNKYHSCRGELLTLQGRYTVLREEYDKMKGEADSKVPYSVHSASVTECRKLFEELKEKYESERRGLADKLAHFEAQKPLLDGRLANVEVEKQQLESNVRSLEALLGKVQAKCEGLRGKLVSTEASRDSAKRQLQKAMAFSEELLQEQEKLHKQLDKQQEETNNMAKLGSNIICRMSSLKSRIKDVEKGTWQEVDVIQKRIEDKAAGMDKLKEEYHREVMRLRNLVKQKETIITRLQKEKSKTEESLEVVWKAATSKDIGIKETLKHVSFRLDDDDEPPRLVNERETS